MEKETVNKLVFNYFLDNKKKDIDKIERAEILKKYIEDNNVSQRELAKELGMSHSTLQDWIMYSRISRDEYNDLVKKGFSHKQIYGVLRETKGESPDSFKQYIYLRAIKDSQKKLTPIINDAKILSNVEITELNELKNIIANIMTNNKGN